MVYIFQGPKILYGRKLDIAARLYLDRVLYGEEYLIGHVQLIMPFVFVAKIDI